MTWPQFNTWGALCSLLRGFFVGDEHFDLVEGFLGPGGRRGSSGRGLGVGGACVGAGDVDFFSGAPRWFGWGEVCDEDYSFTGQHCQRNKKNRRRAS